MECYDALSLSSDGRKRHHAVVYRSYEKMYNKQYSHPRRFTSTGPSMVGGDAEQEVGRSSTLPDPRPLHLFRIKARQPTPRFQAGNRVI